MVTTAKESTSGLPARAWAGGRAPASTGNVTFCLFQEFQINSYLRFLGGTGKDKGKERDRTERAVRGRKRHGCSPRLWAAPGPVLSLGGRVWASWGNTLARPTTRPKRPRCEQEGAVRRGAARAGRWARRRVFEHPAGSDAGGGSEEAAWAPAWPGRRLAAWPWLLDARSGGE